MKIGYLGPKQSFTFQAAAELYDKEDLVPYSTIPTSIQALVDDEIQLAVVPIENSLEGSVHATIDTLFCQNQLSIEQEIILPIRHQLLVHTGQVEVHQIISHPQALAQSAKFLAKYYPQAILKEFSSTTAAAKFVAENPSKNTAAIASLAAAKTYQLQVLAENIQDNAFNQTRFWVLRKKNQVSSLKKEDTKVTLFLTLPSNQPGALHKTLAAFGWRDINLSKIESRPLKTNLGEYFFVIDLVLDKPYKLIENALEEIELLDAKVQLLGCYSVKTIH